MQLPAGRALSAVYEESGGGTAGRRLDVLADPAGRFVVRDSATGTESRCDGATVWSLDDGSPVFVGRVPPGPLDTFALLPPLLAELLHSGSEYLAAAFADPATTDEELPLGCVRISGSDLSIVYDRSIDVVHEYRRPDGLHRTLTALAVVDLDGAADAPGAPPPPWAGPAVAHRGGTVTVSTTSPVARVEDALAGPCFAAHLEHESPVVSYWLDGPGVDGEGLALDRCVAWAQALAADVRVSVDLLSGETVDLRGTTYGD